MRLARAGYLRLVNRSVRFSVIHFPALERERQQIFNERSLILSRIERQASAQRQQPATAPGHESFDVTKLLSRKETRFDATQHQTVISKQLFFSFGKPGDQFLLARNSLPIEFIFAGPLQRYDRNVLLSETQ